VTPSEHELQDLIRRAIASYTGGSPGADGDPTSDVRVPLKPKPQVGSGAIALPLPENVEEEVVAGLTQVTRPSEVG
jgi:hypothetical protein